MSNDDLATKVMKGIREESTMGEASLDVVEAALREALEKIGPVQWDSLTLTVEGDGFYVEGTIPIEDARAAGLLDGSAAGLSIGSQVVDGPGEWQVLELDVTTPQIADGSEETEGVENGPSATD